MGILKVHQLKFGIFKEVQGVDEFYKNLYPQQGMYSFLLEKANIVYKVLDLGKIK